VRVIIVWRKRIVADPTIVGGYRQAGNWDPHSRTKSLWKAQNPGVHACRISEFGAPQERRFWNVRGFG
jgi:hypothetical protein